MTCLFYAGLIFAAGYFVGATIERKLNGKHQSESTGGRRKHFRKCPWDRRG